MAILSSVLRRKRAKSVFKMTLTVLAAAVLMTIYFTGGDIRRLQALTIEDMKVEKHAVIMLLPNDADDLEDLKYNLRALGKYEVIKKETPIVFFHEASFPVEQKWNIMKWTLNPVSFHVADFSFPEGFVSAEGIDEEQTNRNWAYSLTQRFWISGVWKHPAIRQFETVMRIDTDSCFVNGPIDVEDMHLPALRGRYIYRSDGPSTGVDAWIDGLYDFAEAYRSVNNISPSHPELWERLKNMWIEEGTLPVFDTSFEISRVPFFRRRDVMMWHNALTESEPYGVLRNRW
eukprot:CAMPEP_0172479328 /NCGR_PEP_ID=MMETSP1066-20121228/3871_1 /TAXON_ID=671091 /ORGANISM="Coscinodiscus wailesii, Strain CCMP2513" /LENGTH=287 /DNA_ID=CAMNT_0013239717 /DNA_START=46 /DNA_END=906 /DNA_ORIENTATION=-